MTPMNAAKKHAPTTDSANERDAIAMLMADHKKVRNIFNQFEKLKERGGSDEDKAALAQQACDELKVHAQIEEELFYPTAREAIDDDYLMDEAAVEHESISELVEQIEAMQPDDERYDTTVSFLGELVEHHVSEEEEEMFPAFEKTNVDTTALAAEMFERKKALMVENGLVDEREKEVAQPAAEAKRSADRKR